MLNMMTIMKMIILMMMMSMTMIMTRSEDSIVFKTFRNVFLNNKLEDKGVVTSDQRMNQ